MAVTVIESSADLDGLHCWPGAHEARSYLRAPHRHRFVVSARVFVTHADRDVEWHDLRAMLRTSLSVCAKGSTSGGLYDFGSQSCEDLAVRVVDQLRLLHNVNVQRVSVSEDGEFTAHYYPTVPDPRTQS